MIKNLLKRCIRKVVDFAYDDFVLIDPESKIGKNTFIGRYSAVTKARIGNYCSIGTNVLIGPGEHHLGRVSTSSLFYEGDAYKALTERAIEIGHDVWVGSNSVILRGVKVGNGAVIAAGAVVAKDVPPFGIVGGVPAKLIRYRFDEERKLIVQKSKWWEADIDQARALQKVIDQ